MRGIEKGQDGSEGGPVVTLASPPLALVCALVSQSGTRALPLLQGAQGFSKNGQTRSGRGRAGLRGWSPADGWRAGVSDRAGRPLAGLTPSQPGGQESRSTGRGWDGTGGNSWWSLGLASRPSTRRSGQASLVPRGEPAHGCVQTVGAGPTC